MLLKADAKPCVLIVDDEAQVALALADLLEEDYTVLTCNSPHDALEILKANNDISVILSDQRMPGMTGDSLLAQANEISIATRILITAYADINAVVDAINQGKIYGYITKPWDPAQLLTTVRNAAAHCALQRELFHERALLRQLMDSSIDGIAIKDLEHRYVGANNQVAKFLGFENASSLKAHLDDEFLPPERLEIRKRREEFVLKGGAPLRRSIEEVISDDGCVSWYSSSISPIRDINGAITGLVCITRDITESKRLDALKDQFIASISHEIRTPLTAIRGSLDLLKPILADNITASAKRLIGIGQENCSRLSQLIADLFVAVNIENGEISCDRKPIPISNILYKTTASLASCAEHKNIDLTVERDLPQVQIEADPDRLLQAFLKLVQNAIEMTPEGGKVVLQARKTDGGAIRMSVLDEGPGVAEASGDRIFKRFEQGDSSSTREKGGVGLGLYIAKSIVDAHHGLIGFMNRLGKGAEFYLELPIITPANDDLEHYPLTQVHS